MFPLLSILVFFIPSNIIMFIKPLRDDHAVLKGVFTMKDIDLTDFKWTREPERYQIQNGCIAVTTKPHTDLWQRTYYHF